jgi:hypothetical protein
MRTPHAAAPSLSPDRLTNPHMGLFSAQRLLHQHGLSLLDQVPKTPGLNYLTWAGAALLLGATPDDKRRIAEGVIARITGYLSPSNSPELRARATACYAHALADCEEAGFLKNTSMPIRGVTFVDKAAKLPLAHTTEFFNAATKIYLLGILENAGARGALLKEMVTQGRAHAQHGLLGGVYRHLSEAERNARTASPHFALRHRRPWMQLAMLQALDGNISEAAAITQRYFDDTAAKNKACSAERVGFALMLDEVRGSHPLEGDGFNAQLSRRQPQPPALAAAKAGIGLPSYYGVLGALIAKRPVPASVTAVTVAPTRAPVRHAATRAAAATRS